MSNLHKDLPNDQIHDPKDFASASNDTYLSKNASGNLEWRTVSGGGGGGVTQIVAGTNVSISPTGGTGAVTVNATDTNTNTMQMSQNIEAYGSIVAGTEWGLANAQYNSEHKFTVNLGTPSITTITPKNMVSCSIWTQPTDGYGLKSWTGWIWGTGGTVNLTLFCVKFACPPPSEEYPVTVAVCKKAMATITLTGNTTPRCWNITSFDTCDGYDSTIDTNDVLFMTAHCGEGAEEMSFNLNCNFLLEK